jgi:ectoine hydroxylase-related dioxygenase (phytanoyl-CoA dioxygenase family)
MKTEDILKDKPTVLTEAQRASYFKNGYLVIENYVPESWLVRVKAAMTEVIDRSRTETQSGDVFVLEEGHSAADPRLHRVTSPQDQHPVFWELMSAPVITDLVADVVGPSVKFHHAKLNVKAGKGSREFKWHQDVQSWPHTDYSPVTVGIYIDGCQVDQGPLAFVRGSHEGPLYSMYDERGNYAVSMRPADAKGIREELIDRPTGGPGTTILLNCRTIHGSTQNRSAAPRPLLLPVYSSADSFCYVPAPITSPHMGDIVRGESAKYASFDLRPCELPPDWRAGYQAPWAQQKSADERRALSTKM